MKLNTPQTDLKQLREHYELSISDAAHLVGTTHQKWRRMEGGSLCDTNIGSANWARIILQHALNGDTHK